MFLLSTTKRFSCLSKSPLRENAGTSTAVWFFHCKNTAAEPKDSNKTPNKFSQQDSGPASVILNSDELGRRRGNNQTNCDLTNGFFLLLNLVVVPALSNLLTWREWEIIMISPNCRRAIIWHMGCYGSDWLFSHCSCEDAAGSFCHIKRWKQFQKINSWIIKQAPVWSVKLWIRGRNIEGIAGVPGVNLFGIGHRPIAIRCHRVCLNWKLQLGE